MVTDEQTNNQVNLEQVCLQTVSKADFCNFKHTNTFSFYKLPCAPQARIRSGAFGQNWVVLPFERNRPEQHSQFRIKKGLFTIKRKCSLEPPFQMFRYQIFLQSCITYLVRQISKANTVREENNQRKTLGSQPLFTIFFSKH